MVSKKKALAVAAVSAAAVLGTATGAAASPQNTHIAESCSGKSGGMCIYNSGKTLQAWDGGGRDNATLNQWAFYNSFTVISSHIISVKITAGGDANCGIVQFQNFQGKSTTLSIPGGTLPASFQNNVKSFEWLC